MRYALHAVVLTFAVVVAPALGCSGSNSDDTKKDTQLDTSFPDATIAFDTAPADTRITFDTATPSDDTVNREDTSTPPIQGGFGWPCESNIDCLDGYCVEGAEGFFCTRSCDVECPDDFSCRSVQSGSADPAFLCLPRLQKVCVPCRADYQCTGGACLELEGTSWCASNCTTDADCPTSYACQPDATGAHEGSFCQPRSASCECTPDTTGAVRTCLNTNSFGSCYGIETCDPTTGWMGCSARVPAAEICDGLDNDCNALVDDGLTEGEACENTIEGVGTCRGTQVCAGPAGFVCNAKQPSTEVCDFTDNNCDGQIDEVFKDPAGLYASDEHCGTCGASCDGAIPNATAACSVSDGRARCEVVSCAEGFYRAGPTMCSVARAEVCAPCATDANCPTPGDKCLDLDGARVCGRDCSAGNLYGTAEGVCGSGEICDIFGDSKQCVPESRSCACTPAEEGVVRSCSNVTVAGTCYGHQTCNAHGWTTCDAQVPTTETCNDADDNCNGVVDDLPGRGDACAITNADGSCPGVRECSPTGLVCLAATPQPELCNGIDDNCDGKVDELFPTKGTVCTAGVGACQAYGTWVCSPDGLGVTCNAVARDPSDEVCDFTDNNCDGQADEGFKDASGLYVDDAHCGTCDASCEGAIPNASASSCEVYAGRARCEVTTCAPGYYRASATSCVLAQAAVCAPCVSDANCPTPGDKCLTLDGGRFCGRDCSAENLHGTAAGACGDGETCEAVGDGFQCLPTTGSCTCLPGAPGATRSCSDTTTAGTCYGIETCGAAGWSTCDAQTPTVETCNGGDDNCNGVIDDVAGRGAACTIDNAFGSCPGVRECSPTSLVCQAATPKAELCNGVDDNCNGQVDELFPTKGTVCSAGVGACQAYGTFVCASDQLGVVCDAVARDASDEVCDLSDNDCDGQIDEDFKDVNGLYVSDAHCGACNASCEGAIANAATASCEVNAGRARCEVTTCAPGYYRASATSCVLAQAAVCAPCVNDSNCPTPGDKCLTIDGGRFCGRDCSANNLHGTAAGACATGETCEAVGGGFQCVPATGSCSCLPGAPGAERSCTNANSAGTCYGVERCGPAGWSTCDAKTPAAETCNSQDDNCNGVTDDVSGRGDACVNANTFGSCPGVRDCAAGGLVCQAATPKAELCNGLDDNCDGQVDEAFPTKGTVCSAGVGACQAYGTFVCAANQASVVCSATPRTGTAEVCDLIDNNCDGRVDEGFKNASGLYVNDLHCGACNASCSGAIPHAAATSCQVNAGAARCEVTTCAPGYYKASATSCVAAQAAVCAPCVTDANCPTPGDKCLSLDGGNFCGRDCSAGNLYGTPAGTCGSGETCQTFGSARQCVPTSLSCSCLPGSEGTARSCVAQNSSGTCYGQQVCGTSGWSTCDARTPATETCNGQDDNCNGVTDDVSGRGDVCAITNTFGSCSGVRACSPSGLFCQAATPKAELCNGVDDNCDGQVDEAFPTKGAVCSAGVGACQAYGTFVCAANQTGVVCSATPKASVAELCDLADNDCDGQVDEDFKNSSGLYVNDLHCGACNASCAGAIPNATATSCQVNAGAARCEVTTCAPGYYKASATSCVPAQAAVCAPCVTDANCPVPGDKCITIDGGSFCGRDCSAGNLYGTPAGTCAAGQVCQTLGGARQCVPTTQSCTCLPGAPGGARSCVTQNGSGTCYGQQICGASGWSSCDARVPATETCNATDDNCNGIVDDVPGRGDACQVSNGAGTCHGVKDCTGGSLTCSAATPKAELCNDLDDNCNGLVDEAFPTKNTVCSSGDGVCKRYGTFVCAPNGLGVSCDAVPGTGSAELCDLIDNNCDGQVDENFRNPQGKYAQDEHCGNCFTNCLDIFARPNAFGACDATPAIPSCKMMCNAGYFDLNGAPEDGCEFKLETNAVYVSESDPLASDTGSCGSGPSVTGGGRFPCKSITRGLDLAVAAGAGKTRVLVAAGAYYETVTLRGGKSLEGGFSSVNWMRNPKTNLTAIFGTTASGHRKTVIADGITQAGTALDGFVVYGQIASGAAENSYAVWVRNSTNALQIRDNVLWPGTGGAGVPGTRGGDGAAGGNGAPGLIAKEIDDARCYAECSGVNAGGAGGTNTCTSSVNGGAGAGAECPDWRTDVNSCSGATNQSANQSTPPSGANGQGAGGAGGASGCDHRIEPRSPISSCSCYLPGVSSSCPNGQHALIGASGTKGGHGAAGSPSAQTNGQVTSAEWQGFGGGAGIVGVDGGGGGGGGAGGGVETFYITSNNNCSNSRYSDFGGSGGGGGAGGCGGQGGAGGGAGGGAFGLFVAFTTTPSAVPVISGNELHLGTGGVGGRGGDGGTAGRGGVGGAAGPAAPDGTAWCAAPGANGGDGGDGGMGGGGAGGTGGVSYGLFASGGSLPAWGSGNTFVSDGSGGVGGAGGGTGTGGNAGQPGLQGTAALRNF